MKKVALSLVHRLVLLSVATLLGLEGFLYVHRSSLAPLGTQGPNGDTVVLIWSPRLSRVMRGESCARRFNITGCRLTGDRAEYGSAHGVMFHHRDIRTGAQALRNLSRPAGQRWAWMNMESPSNSARAPGLDGLFNLTATYRRDSDVWVPYGHLVPGVPASAPPGGPKDRLVCWVVTNWSERLERVRYFRELGRHVAVDTYGAHFQRPLNRTEYLRTLARCKFYLAFENSVHRDYFTEKLFQPLAVGTVPVVLGPPRQNYEEFLPPGSFIHVDDFGSARELAVHLAHLDRDQEAYARYLEWRKNFTVVRSSFPLEQACRVCEYLKQERGSRMVGNLSAWFWG